MLELVGAFERISGQPIPHKYTGRRAGNLAAFWANPAKANAELGWKTELTIENAVRDTQRYIKLNALA